MKCTVCKHGTLAPGRTTVTIERESTVMVVRDVPADICDTCGEDYISSPVASQLEGLADSARGAGVQFEIREYAAA